MSKRLIPAWVPIDIATGPTASEFANDRTTTRRELDVLEVALGHHVAAYAERGSDDMDARTHRHELCAIFEPAHLTCPELALIREAETRHPGVVFVAYCRPPKRRS
jgi:hypothetical protein